MKRTKIQEAIDHIAKVRKASKLYKDAYLVRVCTTALEALCEKRDREKELREIIEQLERCDYVCEAGPLAMNASFIRLKELAYRSNPEEEQHETD